MSFNRRGIYLSSILFILLRSLFFWVEHGKIEYGTNLEWPHLKIRHLSLSEIMKNEKHISYFNLQHVQRSFCDKFRRCLLLNNAAEGFALFPLHWLVNAPLQRSFPAAYAPSLALKIPRISASSYWKLFASEALYTVLIIMHKTWKIIS